MPVPPSYYPPGWRTFSAHIRFQRALSRCECTGQCGLHPPNPYIRRCTERHHTPARFFHGLVRLTTHHTCNCFPRCTNPAHVLALCQRCHLRCDIPLHTQHRRTKALKKRTTCPLGPLCPMPQYDPLSKSPTGEGTTGKGESGTTT